MAFNWDKTGLEALIPLSIFYYTPSFQTSNLKMSSTRPHIAALITDSCSHKESTIIREVCAVPHD
jgi:hypothetical protein